MNFSGPDGIEIAGIRVADTTLIRIGWILPLVSVVCSMTIHAASGHARDFPFFVSESDYPGLERWFFTIGLALTSPLICLLSPVSFLLSPVLSSVSCLLSPLSFHTSPITIHNTRYTIQK
mgnify:CR=1 FL=1